LARLCDVAVCVPETETFLVQELHLPVYYTLCAMMEERFWGENSGRFSRTSATETKQQSKSSLLSDKSQEKILKTP